MSFVLISSFLTKKKLGVLVLFFACFGALAQTSSSVLAEGEWYKIALTQTGVYKLDANTLKNAGISLNNINPQNIRIFGNGGGMLPQPNLASRPSDLLENAIFVSGETDGVFNDADYILFYAESPHAVVFDSAKKEFTHQTNYYSDTSYVFLNISIQKGLRLKINPAKSTAKATKTIDTFDDFYFHELDQKNMVSSGREWYGEYFGNTTEQSFDLKLDSLAADSPLKITSSVLSASYLNTTMNLSLNGQALGSHSLGYIGSGRYDIKGIEDKKVFTINALATPNLKLTYQFDKKNQSSSGAYLNYFEIRAKRKLYYFSNQTQIRNIESLGFAFCRFSIKNPAQNGQIWEVTNPQKPNNQTVEKLNNEYAFEASTKDTLKTFILFTNDNLQSIKSISKLDNQNIHALQTPDLVIITPKKWLAEAERLAAFRRSNDKLEVAVLTNQQVFNEFSSGIADPTAIRDFMRYLWKQNPAKLKYLLLFGDASFDYKNFKSLSNVTLEDYIPTYESRESLHPIYSFSSDDYFGFLEDKEGDWQEDYNGNHSLEIGIGRLPVKSISEAKTVVDKLIYYANTQKTIGRWRTQISFTADDGDGNIHQADADKLAEIARAADANMSINKIYLDAYPQILQADGARVPQANIALNAAVNDGSLIVNYNGHGGIEGWTEEKLVTIESILKWRNLNNMPLFLTATCEFGRYDDPSNVSGAEMAVLSPKGAAIGLLTTTRPVFANTNFLLNNAFYNEALKSTKDKIGDLMKITKNNSFSGVINRNFSLLGDPSMALAYPQQKIVLKSINGKSPHEQLIKALSKVTLNGEVVDKQAIKQEKFSGNIFVSIFDKISTVNTLGAKDAKMSYQLYKNKIFEGKATVKNGQFELSFIVPKDIDYRVGNGKMYFYAMNVDSTVDAVGSFQDFLIGESETISTIDTTPPKITLSVDENQVLTANIFDENSINTSISGIGHEMLLTLNDTLQVVVNQYYTSLDDYKNGYIKYPFDNLPAGKYTVRLKVWDSYNNSTTEALEFIVSNSIFRIIDVTNYPNPFENQTTFKIIQNRIDDDIVFKIDIFDSKGSLVQSEQKYCYLCPNIFEFELIPQSKNWFNGMYFYSIFAESLNQPINSTAKGKVIYWK